jgi:AraC family transcriptional activator of mtrCDE
VDALSAIVNRLRLRAEILVHAEYCGVWAVNTSGSRRVAFHLLEQGSAWLHVDDQAPRLLAPGDLVVFPHDHQHVIAATSEIPNDKIINALASLVPGEPVSRLLCGFFEFNSRVAWPLLDGLPASIVLDLRASNRNRGTRALLDLLVAELDEPRPGQAAAVDQLAYVLFLHVLRVQMNQPETKGLLRALADPRIGRALNRIHEGNGRRFTVQRLAEAAGMSRSAFMRRFKTLLGVAPLTYASEWQMQTAADLLQTTDSSVSEIAAQSGYASEAAFRKAFKRITGSPPGAIRREARRKLAG